MDSIIVKIKKLNKDVKLPLYVRKGDAGMDVYANSKKHFEDYIEYGTGLAFEFPENYVILVFPRGSVSNKNLMTNPCVGVLDSNYRGELFLRFKKFGEKEYNLGERIGQIIALPIPKIKIEEVEELSKTERGEDRFGSSDKNENL